MCRSEDTNPTPLTEEQRVQTLKFSLFRWVGRVISGAELNTLIAMGDVDRDTEKAYRGD